MILSNFFKELKMKRKLKELYDLKVSSAKLLTCANSSKDSADKITSYLKFRQGLAYSGDYSSSLYLACYLDEKLNERNKYLEDYSSYYQKYLNVLDTIQRLEKDLNNL